MLADCGAARFAIASLQPVDDNARRIYDDWIASRRNGAMDYLQRYSEIRDNPVLLLEGARSIICCAFPYYTPLPADSRPPLSIARYALGRDYHDVVRRRLETVARRIRDAFGGLTRVCVDTAPLRERYWAERARLGFIGRNNQLIIPSLGSYFFLGEILTTLPLKPTDADPLPSDPCAGCNRCLRACPTSALKPDGSCDASRCLSYLTIEYRGDFPESTDLCGSFYGCDRCADVCPYNADLQPTAIEEFLPNPALLSLTPADILSLTPDKFSEIFRGSAMKRAKLSGLQRNILQLKSRHPEP